MSDINESRYYGKRSLRGKFDLKDKPVSDVLKVQGIDKAGNVAVGYKEK